MGQLSWQVVSSTALGGTCSDSFLQQQSSGLMFMPGSLQGLALEPCPGSANLDSTRVGVGTVGPSCPGRWLALRSFLPGLVAGCWWYLAVCTVQVGCG